MPAESSCNTDLLIAKHSFWKDSIFRLKVTGLTLRRTWLNRHRLSTTKHHPSDEGVSLPVMARSSGPLWNTHDNDQNRILTAGKVQNLRIASQQLHGIVVPAGAVFSFWKHMGKPSRARGYVTGREVREGCILPTVAGGLCQLSNALYDAALKAGFEIVERHQHTQVVRGSLAEQGRDATVKWNYIDLRFRSPQAFRIEVEMTPDELIVSFRSASAAQHSPALIETPRPAATINDCYSCGNTTCFKHPRKTEVMQEHLQTVFVVDERWPEFEQHLLGHVMPGDTMVLPIGTLGLIKSPRYAWKTPKGVTTHSFEWQIIQRGLALRFRGKTNGSIPSIFLQFDQRIAQSLQRKIPMECRHVVITQNLLPFAWKSGLLKGRTYDVFMTRLPMQVLHDRLDTAHDQHARSKTLNDFRAPEDVVEAETRALNHARHIITPHSEIAALFNHKSVKLHWMPSGNLERQTVARGPILFPASALGRKGAHLVRQLAQDIPAEITVNPRNLEEEEFWKDTPVRWSDADSLRTARLILYPAYVEHQPRMLLKAIKVGIPVIASAATGLEPSERVTIVPTGDYDAFKKAVQEQLANTDARVEFVKREVA